MNTLVFGKTGQVARELAQLDGTICFGRDSADLSDPDACAALIRTEAPDAVINAAAYTAVDKAEEDEALATTVNGAAVGAMAKTCAQLGIPFVHISTDYVFDGTGETPWPVDAPLDPPNAYGHSKLVGENATRDAGGTYAIMRTSWVVSAHGNNFIKTMLRLAETRDKLTVVADQIGAPTPARDIAAASVKIATALKIDPSKSGTYHFQGSPFASWANFAREIFAQAGVGCAVEDIPTTAFPTPAARPLNSRMDCSDITASFGIPVPEWKQGLSEILQELGAKP